MTPENFVYWLQGWLEIQNPKKINSKELQEIKNHLKIINNPPYISNAPEIKKERKYCSNNSEPYAPQLDCSDLSFSNIINDQEGLVC